MKIVLATPLYPPEVADAAVYAKELARRLSTLHQVTVVAYTHLPEKIENVTVVAIDKRQTRLARLRAFRRALAQTSKGADAVIAINGQSVELPLLVSARAARLIFSIADKTAHERSGLIERLVQARADAVVHSVPGPRPEILPLEPEPTEALRVHEATWAAHLTLLNDLFNHATQ